MKGPTDKELATGLGISRQAICRRAAKEAWPFEWEAARGGKRRRFILAKLPATVQKAWAAHLAPLGPEQHGDLPPTLLPYIQAPEWNKRLADDRAEFLEVVFGRGRRGKALLFYNEDPAYAELRARLGRVSLRTAFRWRSAHREGGLSALLSGCGVGGCRKLTPEMREDITRMIWERWPRAASHIYIFLQHKFGTVPHYRTLLRFIRRYEHEHREALLYKFRPREWRHKMMPSLGDAAASAQVPNEVWEADTTPADLICADGRRRKIIALVDVYSRRALCRLVEREDAEAVVATLRAAILTWGLPKVLKMDNGMVYQKSKHVRRVCTELGIEIPRLPVRAPEAKPHIERFFRTLSESLFAELTGYTGNCLANRPEVVLANLQPEELQALIDRWIEAVYHETVHSTTRQRPRERGQVLGQVIRRVDERELDLLLMREAERVVRQAVVTYRGCKYYHPALVNGERVTLKIDGADAGRVIIFSRGRFLCVAENPGLKGIKAGEIVQTKKRRIKAIKQKVAAEIELAKPGPVDGRIRELLRVREEVQPLSLPQRAEVIRLDRYMEAARVAGPEKESQTPEEDEQGLLFESEADRYKWLIERRVRGEALSEADLTFMRDFEATDLYAELSSYYSTWEAFLRGRAVRDTA